MDGDRPPASHNRDLANQADFWRQSPQLGTDLALRGAQYMGVLRDLAVQPEWVSLAEVVDPPGAALVWIGQHIHRVNQRLTGILEDLLDCFEPAQRPQVQIFAAPIASRAGVDGFCNRRIAPITLMVDPGRIVPADWPGLVAHELAHGVAGAIAQGEGHGDEFGRAIAHLCLAQDLPLPAPNLKADALRYWPPCRRNPHPEAFWLGQLPPQDGL